jgi:hypothetical protein
MKPSPRAFVLRSAVQLSTLVLSLAATSTTAGAQGSGDGFLFRTPTVRLALTGGFAPARAKSDIFDLVTDELTLERGDFVGGQVEASVAIRLRSRLDLVFSTSYIGRTAASESRDFVDLDDLPIEQTTALQRVPIIAGARISLVSPGRAIGRYAWIPAKVVPFVGAGGGAIWYRFSQKGDFVDRESFDVFSDTFESYGWSPAATTYAGVDVSMGPRYGLTGEGRYLWSRASMNRDFSTFNKIDLSGYNASVGVYVRF